MSIKFTAKNVKFNESLKGFANKRLKTIEKISGDIIEAEIIASEEKIDFHVELFLKTRLHSYHIDENDPILKQALRTTLNTLRIQAKKNKEKIKLEKKRKNFKVKHQKMIADEILEPAQPETENKIIVSNNFSNKPLSIDEAIFFLKESNENAYMFINTENDRTSVVFFNKNNKISIIERTF